MQLIRSGNFSLNNIWRKCKTGNTMLKWHFMDTLYEIQYVKPKGVVIAEMMLLLLTSKPCELLMFLGWFLWRNKTVQSNGLRVLMTQLLSSVNLFTGEANLQNMALWLYQMPLHLCAGWTQIIFLISEIYFEAIKQDIVSKRLDIKLQLVKFNIASRSVRYMHYW
jgi:hypothetical protein